LFFRRDRLHGRYCRHQWHVAGSAAAFIQHAAYRYGMDAVISSECLLQGATASTPMRRILVLPTCEVVAGFGWWAVYRLGSPLMSIKKALKASDPHMPLITQRALLLQ